MTNEELTKKWAGLIGDPLIVRKVDNINYHPHLFMIGPAHVAHAADHCGGELGEATMNAIGCAWQDKKYGPKCGMSYDEHTSDRAMFLSLTRNCTQQEIKETLKLIASQLEADKIDGVAFVKNSYNFINDTPVAQSGEPETPCGGNRGPS
jgi:hypothetical protein